MGAQGTATIDFGAFPGLDTASVVITGQAGIVSGSLAEAWIRPVATGDHSVDEHRMLPFNVVADTIVAATGFTIFCSTKGPRLTGQFNLNWCWN